MSTFRRINANSLQCVACLLGALASPPKYIQYKLAHSQSIHPRENTPFGGLAQDCRGEKVGFGMNYSAIKPQLPFHLRLTIILIIIYLFLTAGTSFEREVVI